MARRKGATNKNKNTGSRKTTLENAQTSKKNEKLKDDPGGKMEDLGKKSKKTQKTITSKSGTGKQATETTNNRKDPQPSPTLQQQTHRQSPHPNNNDSKDSVTEKKSIQPLPPTTNNIISSSKDLLKKNNSDNSFSNNNDSSNSNSISNHNNNHNKIVNSTANTTSATPATDSSTYQKYLHKKFKRIASATDDSSESSTATTIAAVLPQPQSTATTTVKPSFLSNGHVNGTTTPSLSSSSSSSSQSDSGQYTPLNESNKTGAAVISSTTATATVNDIVVNPSNNSTGRNVCPFCNSTFNKPSVLEKHIRTHTNERPYPCEICNLAFKTKSNYYKHCRSKSHTQKTGSEAPTDKDDGSFLGSDQEQDLDMSNSSSDVISRTTSPLDERTSSPAVQKYNNSTTLFIQPPQPSPSSLLQQKQQQLQNNEMMKPYKPKFHNAALYASSKEETLKQQQQHLQQSPKSISPFQSPNSVLNNHRSPPPSSSTPPQIAVPQFPLPNPEALQVIQQKIHPTNIYQQRNLAAAASEILLQQQQQHVSSHQRKPSSVVAAGSAPSYHHDLYQISSSSPSSSSQPSTTSTSLNRDSMSPKKNVFLAQQVDVPSAYHVLLKQQQQQQQQLPSLHNVHSYPNNNSKVYRNQVSSYDVEMANTIALKNPTYFQQVNEQQQHHHQKISNHQQQQQVAIKIGGNLDVKSVVGSIGGDFKLNNSTSSAAETNGSTAVINPMVTGAQPLNFEERINNLIAQNEVVLETKEPLLKNKKTKTLNRQKSITSSSSSAPQSKDTTNSTNTKLAQTITMKQQQQQQQQFLQAQLTLQQQQQQQAQKIMMHQQMNGFYQQKTPPRPQVQIVQHMEQQPQVPVPTTNVYQPLNLSKPLEASPSKTRNDEPPAPLNEASSLASAAAAVLARNPERSIIKNLLLAKEQQETMDGSDSTQSFMCTVCQMAFRSSDDLKAHTTNYCRSGGAGKSGSKSPSQSPSYKYFRSNSFMSIPDVTNPSSLLSLAKSAMSKSIVKLAWSQLTLKTKPSNLIMNHLNPEASTSSNSKALLAWTMQMNNDTDTSSNSASPALIDTSLPSPGPRLGKTALVDSYQPTENKKPEEVVISKVYNQEPPPPQPQQHNLEEKELHMHSKRFKTQQEQVPVKQVTVTSLPIGQQVPLGQHFQFPPINPINTITAFNPLTLAMANESEKVIPYVPGIPGPNTLLSTAAVPPPPQNLLLRPPQPLSTRSLSPAKGNNQIEATFNMRSKPIGSSVPQPPPAWNSLKDKRSFNFARMADNLSPKKMKIEPLQDDAEVRRFNFENVKKDVKTLKPLSIDIIQASPSPPNAETPDDDKRKNSKFLRPSTLPLKPGTFTPKRHHGITPTANTLPLISPETPRPSKACAQLYLNGHAYTYLGLKCSTKMFYCTVNCPQPTYVANNYRLSMYSKWQAVPESKPHPMKLDPKKVMSLYDSRPHLNFSTTTATSTLFKYLTADKPSAPIMHTLEEPSRASESVVVKVENANYSHGGNVQPPSGAVIGGYESNEDYTYIRGRGRGRYVCNECGIRCKKPSMLKKHIRTHTDVRPYTCKYCNFSFKTKGNLTKHMQSKAHYKKCLELGIYKGPMPADSAFPDNDNDIDQQSITSGGGRTSNFGESDSDDSSDVDEESSDTDESKSRLPEHEAAHCLLSLSMTKGTFNNYAQPAGPQIEPVQPLPSKRIVSSYSSPKPPYEFKHDGKYYSKPEVSKSNTAGQSDEPAKPMDLTKPKKIEQPIALHVKKMPIKPTPIMHKPVKFRDVIGEISTETGMLKSLVSLTDIVRGTIESSNVKMDENILPQNYLTEQALHQSKIKQCQMQQPPSNVVTVTVNAMRSSSMIVTSTVESSVTITPVTTASVVDRQNEIFDSLKRGDKHFPETVKVTPTVPEKPMDESEDSLSDQEFSAPTSTSSSTNDFLNVFNARKMVVGEEGNFKNPSSSADSVQPMFPRQPISEDGKPVCTMCSKVFQKPHQLVLHMNIHYMERKFKCEPCGVSFRTQGHLQKHERSEAHKNKVMMTSTFGVPTTTNPRPFECTDCKIAFRIHGHLAKHLRSKTHVQKLECLQKLPFGTYAEIERAGINLTEIDTTDCENSLTSLRILARKLFEKDPTKLASYTRPSGTLDSGVSHGESGESDQDMNDASPLPVKRKISTSQDHSIDDKRQKTESVME